nr:hypothetical protein [Tanacetum cinerariifolium]
MGKELFDPNGERCGGNGGIGSSMMGRGDGWLAKRSIVSNEGCGSGGLAVRGGRSLSKSKKGEIPGEVIIERDGDIKGLDGGVVRRFSRFHLQNEAAFDKEGNWLSIANSGSDVRFLYVFYGNRERGSYLGRWHLYCQKDGSNQTPPVSAAGGGTAAGEMSSSGGWWRSSMVGMMEMSRRWWRLLRWEMAWSGGWCGNSGDDGGYKVVVRLWWGYGGGAARGGEWGSGSSRSGDGEYFWVCRKRSPKKFFGGG